MMDQMCNGNVFLVGRVFRSLHEVGLHAQAVGQWPIGERRSVEWAHVVRRYFEGRRLLNKVVSDFLDPIEAEIDAVTFWGLFEMEGTLQDRLPEALATVEAVRTAQAQGRSAVAGDHSVLDDVPKLYEAVVILTGLVRHVFTHFSVNPFPVNPNIGFGSRGVGGVAILDERDDPAVIEHLRAGLASGAFSEGLDPARSTVEGRDIPIEDRGRTNQNVGGPSEAGFISGYPIGVGEIGGAGAGDRQGPMQWLAIGMWATQAIPQLVALIKNIKNK